MAATITDVALIMEAWAPANLAEAGDNTGLLAGVSSRPVSSVLVALDVTADVILRASEIGAELIVAHHPFLYRPVPSITDATVPGGLAVLAIERGIAVFAAHTNLDRAAGGVNDALCEAVGLPGAAPAAEGSIGRIAGCPGEMALDDFAAHVRSTLGAPVVRVTGRADAAIRSVYVCSGAGRHDIPAAEAAGADCLLTGEIGYHDALDAAALGLSVVEAGHYHTEAPVLSRIEKHLQSRFEQLQYTVRTVVYDQSTCPFRYLG